MVESVIKVCKGRTWRQNGKHCCLAKRRVTKGFVGAGVLEDKQAFSQKTCGMVVFQGDEAA